MLQASSLEEIQKNKELKMSSLPIEKDKRRFKQIVRKEVENNLHKYIKHKELIGRRGKEMISIPIPEIQIPKFIWGAPGIGVGQGPGEIGEPIGQGEGEDSGEAGNQPGRHIREVEVTLEELAQILGEQLELPRIEPKQKNNVEGIVTKYRSRRRVGPETLRCFKATYVAALKRMIAEGLYDPKNPYIIPIRDDKRYRSWKEYPSPQSNAVIFYMMDVSGSMTDERKDLVRLTSFWIDTWLRFNYKNIISEYIIHDMKAYLVSEDDFYNIRESGGTYCSSAYTLCLKELRRYPINNWNVYGFHFTDGENWPEDNERSREKILELSEVLNMFSFGQVQHRWGDSFKEMVDSIEAKRNNIVTVTINSDDDIYNALRTFFKKGL